MLLAEHVSRKFGTTAAVSDASFCQSSPAASSEVIGRSGAGKSTLLRMINRLVDPSAGRIVFDGDRRHRAARAGAARLARALRHDLPAVQPGRPPRRADQRADGPAQPRADARARCSSCGADEDKAIALSALEQFDIASLAAQRADTLSGGQQQRVAIARALVQEPRHHPGRRADRLARSAQHQGRDGRAAAHQQALRHHRASATCTRSISRAPIATGWSAWRPAASCSTARPRR